MLAEIQKPEISLDDLPTPSRLPQSLLYATSAKIGGSGLDMTAFETLKAAYSRGFLGLAIGYGNQQSEISADKVLSLRFHPVRLLSNLDRKYYYGAKKHYVDWIASRKLETGRYDCFHGWSNDSLRSLEVCRRKGIPSMIEIPTWHVNKGKVKPDLTRRERELAEMRGPKAYLNRLLVTRQRILREYELCDLLLIQSEMAARSFLEMGFDPKKIFYVSRGVNPDHYRPTVPPDHFRLIFVGALIKRKGIHTLLKAWKKLALKDAELVLVGTIHEEMKPYLDYYETDSVTLKGFVSNVPEELGRSTAFVFPSVCEGSAKATHEAGACALPMIATRESGDLVIDGYNGLIVPPDDVDALAEAIRTLYDHPERLPEMGAAARRRIEEGYTWDHFRARLLAAYEYLCG